MSEWLLTREELKELRRTFAREGAGYWGDYVAKAALRKVAERMDGVCDEHSSNYAPSSHPIPRILCSFCWQEIREEAGLE